MRKRELIVAYRMLFSFLGFSAIVTETATIIDRGQFVPGNFFSYFTIESNAFTVIVLVLTALALAYGVQNKLVAMLRGANTLYMIIVGLVFTLLLSGIKDAEFTAVPWDNIVLHYIMPVAVVLDWLLDIPRQRVLYRKALVWLLFPLVYVFYSLIRGYLVGWYPYPFLDPSTSGYTGVTATSIVLLLVGMGLTWILVWSVRIMDRDRMHSVDEIHV